MRAGVVGIAVVAATLTACSKDAVPPEPSVQQVEPTMMNAVGSANIGVNIVGITSYSQSEMRLILQRLGNIRHVRFAIGWADTYPNDPNTQDTSYLAKVDALMAVVQELNLTPVVHLVDTPCWAQPGLPCERKRPASWAHWGYWQSFVYEMVTRYPNVTYWEIGNEPNDVAATLLYPDYVSAACPNGDWLEAYVQAFLHAADVIQPMAGKVIVAPSLAIGGGPSCGESEAQAMNRFVATLGYRMRQSIDIVNVHSYQKDSSLKARLWTYDAALGGSNLNNKIWVTEWGFDEGMEEDDANWQAYVTTGAFKLLTTSALPSRVTRMYKFHLFESGFRILEVNKVSSPYSFSITDRPAIVCLRILATFWNNFILPNYCKQYP